MIRVLHVINGELYSGAERVQDMLALNLPRWGYQVDFACLKSGRFRDSYQAQCPIHPVHMRSRFDMRPGLRLARLVRREGYRLLHTHTPRSALAGSIASALTGIPMIHHVHSPTARDSEMRLRNRLNAAMENLSTRRARALIAVSASVAQYLRDQHCSEDKIHVVVNGVPTRQLPERPAPTRPWVIGCIALFRPRKGVETLLTALAHLKQQGLQARVRAVGPFVTEAYERATKALAQRLGVATDVDWLGFVADVPAELMKMDLLAVPSLYGEGLPLVVLEAMAAGVPVVGSRVEGVMEAIEHERSGLLVPPDDPPALADALSSVMTSRYDWSELRVRAHARQQTLYSDLTMASGAAALYARVLGNGAHITSHSKDGYDPGHR